MRFACHCFLLLVALAMSIQGSYLIAHHLANPAHYHRGSFAPGLPDPQRAPGRTASAVADKSEGHQHGHHADQHDANASGGGIGNHVHDADDASVVYVADGGREESNGTAPTVKPDPYWPIPSLAIALTMKRERAALLHSGLVLAISHAGGAPLRPPRA